jgi:plastocyanin
VRRRNTFLVGLLFLGVVAAVMPALASSEAAPTVTAVGGGYGEPYGHSWSPSQVTIGAGGVVTFTNPSAEVPHGIIWTSAVKPTCEEGAGKVPVGEEHFGTSWSGSCTFTQPGTYAFECSVHHREMTGTITVNPNGTTTVTMTTGTSTTTTTTNTAPGSGTPTPTTSAPKPAGPQGVHLTRAQKLARALKACKRGPKSKRAVCERRARKRFGAKRRK